MRFPCRAFLGVAVLAVAWLLLPACGAVEEEQPADQATETAVAAPTVTETEAAGTSPTAVVPSPTARQATSTASSSELSLDDAAYYLDASAVLPGFEQLDPAEEGLSNEDLDLGSDYSEVVAFLSEEPLQTVFMFMLVASGEIEKASLRAELRDEERLEEAFLEGFFQGAGSEDVETTVAWSDAPVGDAAKLARVTAALSGAEIEVEMVIFFQEEGEDGAAVFIGNMWLPGEPPEVTTITVAREISDRIANR